MRSTDDHGRQVGQRGRTGRPGPTRRAVLRTGAVVTAGAAVALAGAGCGLFSDERPPPQADPLAPLLAGTVDLLGRYDAALAGFPDLTARLTPIRQAHQAHVTALAELIGLSAAPVPPSGTPAPGATATGDAATGDPGDALDGLRTAEEQARQAAANACLAAPVTRAALLGSIAAARASHAEALR